MRKPKTAYSGRSVMDWVRCWATKPASVARQHKVIAKLQVPLMINGKQSYKCSQETGEQDPEDHA